MKARAIPDFSPAYEAKPVRSPGDGMIEAVADANQPIEEGTQESGAGGGTRTHTARRPPDFESGASTNFTTPASIFSRKILHRKVGRLRNAGCGVKTALLQMWGRFRSERQHGAQASPRHHPPMLKGRAIILALLFAACMILHHTVVPFPPWAHAVGAYPLIAQMGIYLVGTLSQGASTILAGHGSLSRILHWISLHVFLWGGVALFVLNGKPYQAGSMWVLHLLVSYLGHRAPKEFAQE